VAQEAGPAREAGLQALVPWWSFLSPWRRSWRWSGYGVAGAQAVAELAAEPWVLLTDTAVEDTAVKDLYLLTC